MKKIFILLIPVLTACSIQAFSQKRTIDLTATLLSPVNNDVANPGQQINITTRIKNLGPDTLTQSDTIEFMLIYDGYPIQFGNPPLPYLPLNAPYLEPGDSTQSNFQFTISNNWPTGPASFCVVMLMRNAQDTIVDNDTLNNKSCAAISVEYPVSVNVLTSTIGDVSVYPNPVSDMANFAVTLNKASDVQVIVTDITGRVVMNELRNNLQGKQVIKINTSSLSEGTYLYKVNTGSEVKTGKMIVR